MTKTKPHHKKQSFIEMLATRIPRWMGSTQSLVVHTFFFVGIFVLVLFGISLDQVMLILTTAVSLEAIYLSLFIQMTVNRHSESLEDVEEDIDEIQEDIEGIEGDIDEIQEDVEGIEGDVTEVSEDIDEIQKRDLEEEEEEDELDSKIKSLQKVETDLSRLLTDISSLRDDVEIIKKRTLKENGSSKS